MFSVNKKYVFTGAIGSGKTSSINELKKRGFYVVQEIAESLIKELQYTGRKELPWLDRLGFQNIIFPFLINNYKSVPNDKQVFFDRGFPDELAFFMQDEIMIPDNYLEACRTYQYEKVFLFPAWEEIYQKTAERPWSFQEVKFNSELIKKAYQLFNYELIEVPKISLEKRVDFILSKL